MLATSLSRTPRSQRGFGIVEIMVGVVIGLLALLIIYRGLALSEGYRRTTTAGGDAQSAGMISTFVLAQDISNAGNTIADTAPDLLNCPNTGSFATTWRPIPVLITDGGADNVSDEISVFYGVSRRLVTQVDTRVNAAPNDPFQVQSPLAWSAGNRFVVTSRNPAPHCDMSVVTAVAGPDAIGVVTLTHTGTVNSYLQPAWIVNLGPQDNVRKAHYAIAAETLTVDNLLDGAPPTPVTSNVVLFKAQYGIDTSVPPDNMIDTWVSARAAPWTPADVLGANEAQLRRIKAVRVAMIVRSSQFERGKDAEGQAVTGGATAGITNLLLFPCNGLPGCTGELDVTIASTANFRYRVFEQVVPLRNQIWNP
jgi:type IV pilus assembly protein PilW